MIYLNEDQVVGFIKKAEKTGETCTIQCVRKGKASKPGGPDAGDTYDLVCGPKPRDYEPVGTRDRRAEDKANHVLTVFSVNRQNRDGSWGAWRRVNTARVETVVYRDQLYTIRH